LLYAGLIFFWIAALSLTQTNRSTPHALIALEMMAGGLGLGMLLPNLTFIAQTSAPRTQLGVATAMLQSMRMVGSMLGTALVGSLITSLYAVKIAALLRLHPSLQHGSWLTDPQILVDRAKATAFASSNACCDPASAIEEARNALTGSIHASQWSIAALLFIALYLVRRIPRVNIHATRTGDHELS
jgi:hypothetical protein